MQDEAQVEAVKDKVDLQDARMDQGALQEGDDVKQDEVTVLSATCSGVTGG